MPFRRRAFEPGHRPKILTVIDNTPECARAVHFAARRAHRFGSGLIMLAVIVPDDGQPWLGVGDIMQAEAEAEANERLDAAVAQAENVAGIIPERVILTGKPAEQIRKLIETDEDIASLVLAAGDHKDGPGPLVSLVAGRMSASFPVPVTIVPGMLAAEDFAALF